MENRYMDRMEKVASRSSERADRIGQKVQKLRPIQKIREIEQSYEGRAPTVEETQAREKLKSRVEANPRFQQLQAKGQDLQRKTEEKLNSINAKYTGRDPKMDRQEQQQAQMQSDKAKLEATNMQAQLQQQQQAQKQQDQAMKSEQGGAAASSMGSNDMGGGAGYAKGGYVNNKMIVNKGVGASMKPHNVFGSKGKK